MVLGLLSDAFIVISIFSLHLTQRKCNPPLILLLSLQKKRGRLRAIQPISYIRGILFFFFFLHILQTANTSEDVIVGERIVFQFSTVFISTNLIISLTHRGFYLQLVTSLPNLLRLSRMILFFKATVDCPYFQFWQLEPWRFGLTALGFNINHCWWLSLKITSLLSTRVLAIKPILGFFYASGMMTVS